MLFVAQLSRIFNLITPKVTMDFSRFSAGQVHFKNSGWKGWTICLELQKTYALSHCSWNHTWKEWFKVDFCNVCKFLRQWLLSFCQQKRFKSVLFVVYSAGSETLQNVLERSIFSPGLCNFLSLRLCLYCSARLD